MTKRLFIFFLIFYSANIIAQTTQVAYIHLQVKDSSGEDPIYNAKVSFIKNDTSFIFKGGNSQFKLTRFLSDTIVVDHWCLGTSKIPFSLKNNSTKELIILLPKPCSSTRKTNICPICKSKKNVINIVYGDPAEKTIKKAEEGKIILGGCMVQPCNLNRHCTKDDFSF